MSTTDQVNAIVRRELLRLAELEESLAAREATAVPYWMPCPPSVHGRREAALALRADADRFLS